MNDLISINNFLENRFIDKSKEQYVNNVINKIYVSLNSTDKQYLLNALILIINYINIKFTINWDQLIQKDNLDLRAILNMLLPFITDDTKKHQLKNLSELYSEKYTNVQYNRALRSPDKVTLMEYKHEFLVEHCKLLLSSIDACSHKLYINWINVVPLVDYQGTQLYKQTKDKINSEFKLILDYLDSQPGLSLTDIYNVINNNLYQQVKQEKWLIYDLNVNKNPQTVLGYLESVFDLAPIWQQKSYYNLNQSQINDFKSKLEAFINPQTDLQRQVLNYFYYFFQKYHVNAERLVREGKLELIENKEDDEPEEIEFSEQRIRSRSLNRVPEREIYLYLYNQLTTFKRTFYYYQMYILKKPYYSKSEFKESKSGENYTYYITFKNIFNYAKSCVYYAKEDLYFPFPKLFQTLNTEFINLFTQRIKDRESDLNNDHEIWFNIYGNLGRFYKQRVYVIAQINDQLKLDIQDNLTDIIFQTLIYQGKLSQIIPNQKANADNYQGAYYYLTSQLYDKQTDLGWSSLYALNWVSQINFYHHHYHNRVILVTGGTGVGKSTQIPKLLIYSQFMLNYKYDSRTIMTEPRIPPTISNSVRIAKELGVPIKKKIPQYELEVDEANYYVQYKYNGGEHTNSQNAYLKIVTDGTLFEEIKQNAFLSYRVDNQYRSGNIYDNIVVDEAHEHNTNMDMILTLMRDAMYINNSLKLVIISATMDDDEPIYRRYYRDINDNRMFPLNVFIKHNQLDRINMDRRIHISAPGQTTIAAIHDYYPADSQLTDKNYLQAGIDKTLKLANETKSGDILLFVATVADIEKAQNIINNSIPNDMIAFGFYGAMSEEQKQFITKINENLSGYTRYKSDINLPEEDIVRRVSPNTYKKTIIIATNIAEASLTFPTLKYVVDTGYANVVTYNPLNNDSVARRVMISNSSSLQRRGRVGRGSEGYFYPLYPKEKVINNEINYSIVISDISQVILSLLQSKLDDEPIIQYDINNLTIIKELSHTTIEELGENKHIANYYNIIATQYYYNISKFYDYYGNDQDNDYLTYQFIYYSRLYSGYDSDRLKDNKGEFYIIHPDENIILREKYTGKLIGLRSSNLVDSSYYYYTFLINNIDVGQDPKTELNKFENIFKSGIQILPKTQLTFDNLQRLSLVIYDPSSGHYIASALNQRLDQLNNLFGLEFRENINNLLWYMYNLPYGDNDILAMICMIDNSNLLFNPENIIKDDQGDLHYMWILWTAMKPIIEKQYQSININDLQQKFMSEKRAFTSKSKINEEDYNILNSMANSGTLNSENEFYNYAREVKASRFINRGEINNLTRLLMQVTHLSNEFLNNFLRCYITTLYTTKLKTWAYNYEVKNEIKTDRKNDEIEWIKTHLLFNRNSVSSGYELIYDTYIRAYSTNLLYNIYDRYINISTGTLYQLNNDFYTRVENTAYMNKSRYMIYYTIVPSFADKAALVLTPVDIKKVFAYNPVFYYYLFFNEAYTKTMQKLNSRNEASIIYNKQQVEVFKGLYDKSNLISYLDTINDPVLSTIMRKLM